MLVGAQQIITGVSGLHLDPSYMIRSQKKEVHGYIMVAYQTRSSAEDHPSQRFFDVLLFHGSDIIDSARMNQDLRFHIHHDDVFRTFEGQGSNDETTISLFQLSPDLLQLFRSTIYFEPSLKTQLKGLPKKQLHRLLRDTSCRRGIIECSDLTSEAPQISLLPVSTPEDLTQYHPPFRNGRLLLYDTERNQQLVNDRFSSMSGPITGIALDDLEPGRPRLEIFDSSKTARPIPEEPFLDENEAQELIDTINKILNAPSDLQPREPANAPILITQTPIRSDSPEQEHEEADEQTPREPQRKQKRTPRKKAVSRKPKDIPANLPPTSPEPLPQNQPAPSPESGPGDSAPESIPQTPPTSVAETPPPVDDTTYIRLFERLFRSFRQQLFDSYGDKTESVIAESESRVRFLTPEFDLRSLDAETAIVVLDLVQSIIDLAPFFRRGKLKEAAVTLIADLYNKQYELLEQRRAIERVEQFYYKLKRQ